MYFVKLWEKAVLMSIFYISRCRFAHRLDYATSGILCLCLNKLAARALQTKFYKKKVTKYYLALVSNDVCCINVFNVLLHKTFLK